MATYERHLTSRRLRSGCVPVAKDLMPSKGDSRRSVCRSARKVKTMRAHHQPTPASCVTTSSGKMERIDRSLRELAQLLGLQTVGVDEASLLETTVAFFRSAQDEPGGGPGSQRRGRRHAFGSPPDMDQTSRPPESSEDGSPTDAILAGFQDCMEETIRYLVDVEGFSPDDEVVVGLTAHLLQVRATLDINNDSTAAASWSGRSRDGEGPTECEATTSTQTSPQESNTLSLALASESRQPSAVTSAARTLQGGILARGLPPAHYMTPLTVDTNQYYALPSPLNRTAMACAMKPSEPLLTVAQTRPTHATPTYSTAAVASSLSGQSVTATTSSAFPRRSGAVTSVQQQYQSVLPSNGCLIPCVPASASAQRPYGFNLNYVAPYVVAWVRPVQE
ncbi:uncharacterized protein [Diadema setosum]|uniref:uncharacterized protein isoform X1 n=2 Tax=Diadema setosum TaxID=31175 RepID=UPI003B3A3402